MKNSIMTAIAGRRIEPTMASPVAYAAALRTKVEKREIANSTGARKFSVVRGFFEFCVGKGVIYISDTARITD